MITVKYINRAGMEEIFSCERVIYRPDLGDVNSFGEAGLYIDPTGIPDPTGMAVPQSRFAIPVSNCASAGDVQPRAYIMNDKGATVATYAL